MSGDTTLEQEIATALAATDIASSDLSALLVEADAAIAAADKTAEEERSKALDPALSPDPKAARQAMEDAEFARDRLKTLLPRLETRYNEIAEAEALASWKGEAEELEARRVVWPPPQPNLALQYLAIMPPDPFIASEAMNYVDERHRRMLEDNRKQIAEAEQRQRERQEREAAEARKAQEADRAAWHAKHSWPA